MGWSRPDEEGRADYERGLRDDDSRGERVVVDRDVITDWRKWPGETLCLKRRPRAGEEAGVMGYAAFGVLTSTRPPLVIHLRGRTPGTDFATTETYASVDELLAAGWGWADDY